MSHIRNKVNALKTKYPLYARLLQGGAWKVGGTVVVSLLSVVINGLLARLLSPSDMGHYAFTLSVVTTVSLIAKIGLGSIAIREISGSIGRDDIDKAQEILQWILKWGILSIISISLIFSFKAKKIGIQHHLVLLVTGWLALLASQQILVDIIRGFKNTQVAALLHGGRIGGAIASIVVVICLYTVWKTSDNIPLKSAIYFLIAGVGIAFIITGSIVKWNIKTVLDGISFNFHLPPLKILGMTLPILIHDLSSTLLSQSSIWVLKYFQPTSEIAIYGTAQQLAAFLSIQQSIVIFVLSPEIAALYAQGEIRKLEKLQRRVATLASMPVLIAFLVLLLNGEEILELLYGNFYRLGKPVVILLATGYLGHVMAGSCGLTLMMTGHQMELMKISLISGFLTLIMAALVVWPLGLLGVAGVTSLGYIIKNIWMVITVKKRIGIWTTATLKWN